MPHASRSSVVYCTQNPIHNNRGHCSSNNSSGSNAPQTTGEQQWETTRINERSIRKRHAPVSDIGGKELELTNMSLLETIDDFSERHPDAVTIKSTIRSCSRRKDCSFSAMSLVYKGDEMKMGRGETARELHEHFYGSLTTSNEDGLKLSDKTQRDIGRAIMQQRL